jgi:hypothetical protein
MIEAGFINGMNKIEQDEYWTAMKSNTSDAAAYTQGT